MKFIKVIFILLAAIIIIGLINLLYLPGPDYLHFSSIIIYSIMQLVTGFLIFVLPAGIIWFLINKEKKKNLRYPIILISFSIFLLINGFFLTKYFRDFSREYTIDESRDLISAIELYKLKNLEYPENLSDLTPIFIDSIPNPKIICVEEFTYSKKDSIYELVFTQHVVMILNFEVVIYNPMGTQEGYGELPTLYETSVENWKYFIFD